MAETDVWTRMSKFFDCSGEGGKKESFGTKRKEEGQKKGGVGALGRKREVGDEGENGSKGRRSAFGLIKVYNLLPQEVVQANSVKQFQKRLQSRRPNESLFSDLYVEMQHLERIDDVLDELTMIKRALSNQAYHANRAL